MKSGICSINYGLIYNLYNTAVWHITHCDESCIVSLFQLKQAASILAGAIWPSEREDIDKLFSEWPN